MLLEPAGILGRRAAVLHQQPGEQTERMAMAIVANAMTFHATLVTAKLGVRSFDELRRESPLKHLSRSIVIAEWRRILSEINYWPIFQIADDLMSPVSAREATSILEHLARVADALTEIGTATTHDLSGQMFGRLIADRKFLATFYTLPASAALLAELAAARLDVGWSNPEAFADLRIADLACGTGALLAAAYRAAAARHRRAGGDDAPLHAAMMEHASSAPTSCRPPRTSPPQRSPARIPACPSIAPASTPCPTATRSQTTPAGAPPPSARWTSYSATPSHLSSVPPARHTRSPPAFAPTCILGLAAAGRRTSSATRVGRPHDHESTVHQPDKSRGYE